MPSARRLTRPSKTKEEEEEEEEEKGRHRRSQRLYHFLLHGPLHDTGEERDSRGQLGALTGTPGKSPDSDPAARCAPLGTVTVTPTKAADRHVPPWLAPPVPTAWKLPERRLQQGSHDTRATATYTWRGRGGWADMSYRERPRRLAVIDHSGCGRRPPAERSGTWAKS
ncbi:MAG: hypothetical protein WDW38_003235 [Sanguina aurantia]